MEGVAAWSIEGVAIASQRCCLMLSSLCYSWFFPNLSRTRAENILKSEVRVCVYYVMRFDAAFHCVQGREGGFVVRNSSRENMYTLSIW